MIEILYDEYSTYYGIREITVIYNRSKYSLEISNNSCMISEVLNHYGDTRTLLDIGDTYAEFECINNLIDSHRDFLRSLDNLIGTNFEKFIK